MILYQINTIINQKFINHKPIQTILESLESNVIILVEFMKVTFPKQNWVMLIITN